MTKADETTPQQVVCTGVEGSDEWNCAFGTWAADDFGIDSNETVGKGERLYVRRDLYDISQARIAELESVLRWYGEQARLARLIHSEGDEGRHALAADGGKTARETLKDNP
jgi:hypothetical protein